MGVPARAAVEAPEGGRAPYGAQPSLQMGGANRVHLFGRLHMVGMRLSALRLPFIAGGESIFSAWS
jgi:hypothetical protein